MLSIRGTSHGPVSVCPSQVGVLSKRLNESSSFLACELSFTRPTLCKKGNSVISKNKGTSLWNFVLNSGLRKLRHGISIVETCYQLSSRKVDAQNVINWAVVGQLSRRSTTIVYRIDRQALSTARFYRTGQLATADTWFRTCRTSSFCTVAWQLARFQRTRRIARSLGDS